MAFLILVLVEVESRKTGLRIQCNVDNQLKRFSYLMRDRDINRLYYFKDQDDDFTLLIDICTFLQQNSADPKKYSTKLLMTPHYAALTAGVPLSIMKNLLAANANPNECLSQIYTLLQFAAGNGHEDIMNHKFDKTVELIFINFHIFKIYKSVEHIVDKLLSQRKEFKKEHMFFSLSLKEQEEHPFLNLILNLNEFYYPTISVEAVQYQKRRWHKTSFRWKSKLEKMASMDEKMGCRLNNLFYVPHRNFYIASGSDRTQVYLGLKDDGTEVAVKRMTKSNNKILKNEQELLRLPKLDTSPYIVRYVDLAEDANFSFLVLQLCECTLEEYIEYCLPKDSTQRASVLKRLVKDVLSAIHVLHDTDTSVLHCDIKPQNFLIAITGKATLADFGISRRLKPGQTTVQTRISGTRCWKAKETINEKVNTGYDKSSEIQVTGMLVFYILSGGYHPFGDNVDCEYNILRGKYSLDQLDDDVAKDLVEWMLNDNPKDRPDVEDTLKHPFFWTDAWRVKYLKTLGNEKEVQNYRNAEAELLGALAKEAEGKNFAEWKSKFQPELVQKLDGKKKVYLENTLGLLRFIRNLHEHYPHDVAKIDLMALFPDLFGSVYTFFKNRGWNDRDSVRKEIDSFWQY